MQEQDEQMSSDMALIYAGLWKRFLSGILDNLVLVVPIMALAMLATLLPGGVAGVMVILTVQLLSISYYTYFLGKSGQTIGDRVIGIKVVNLDGSSISYMQAFLRSLTMSVTIIPYLGLILSLVSIGMIYFDKKKQGLHDKILKHVVIFANASQAETVVEGTVE